MNFKKLTTIAAIIIIIIALGFGAYYHFKDGAPLEIQMESQDIHQMANVPDTTISQEHVTTEYVAPVEDVPVVVEPVVEANWWDGKAGYENAQVGTYSTMFDTDVDAVKNMVSDTQSYNLFDIETEERILNHQELDASQLNLDRELQPAQYKELVAEYGTPVHVTMETIDDDPTQAGMDHVAVNYVGSKDVWEFKDNFHQHAGLENYISANIIK